MEKLHDICGVAIEACTCDAVARLLVIGNKITDISIYVYTPKPLMKMLLYLELNQHTVAIHHKGAHLLKHSDTHRVGESNWSTVNDNRVVVKFVVYVRVFFGR